MTRLVLLGLLLVFATAAAPQASLPDIEDEVMCVECGTALNVSTSTVADQERAFIRRQIALGQGQAGGQGRAGRGVRPRRAGRPALQRLRPRRLPRPGPARLLGIAGVAIAARRWRRQAGPAPEAGEPLGDEDARRLDAELAAYDRR